MGHHAIPVRIRVNARGEISWNGVAVDKRTFTRYLEEARPLDPLPFLILSADGRAPCDRVKQVRNLMDERYCKLRWACGEGEGDWQQRMY